MRVIFFVGGGEGLGYYAVRVTKFCLIDFVFFFATVFRCGRFAWKSAVCSVWQGGVSPVVQCSPDGQ